MAENEANLPAEQDAPAAATDAATSEMSDTMQEPNAEQAAGEAEQTGETEQQSDEEITYHAVEKDGHVTAIWEMQGRKHLRTIDPRSRQGLEILRLYTSEHEHQ